METITPDPYRFMIELPWIRNTVSLSKKHSMFRKSSVGSPVQLTSIIEDKFSKLKCDTEDWKEFATKIEQKSKRLVWGVHLPKAFDITNNYKSLPDILLKIKGKIESIEKKVILAEWVMSFISTPNIRQNIDDWQIKQSSDILKRIYRMLDDLQVKTDKLDEDKNLIIKFDYISMSLTAISKEVS